MKRQKKAKEFEHALANVTISAPRKKEPLKDTMLTPETLAQVAELEEEKMTDDGKGTEESKERNESAKEGD